ncbi:uncharacterized protein LAJ45_02965 [Morchella importuna]|uniref:uncharacterized protein n=1 Tax=Morchella importuna TaxID=1174673 RepID=UPI001E8E75F8|nr:uncharacterized protein LAJ45_02965 [Morchella importuna]KAH8152741.1 hypothetical protein LAJ45_02965 [Morchella importuna]
MSIAIVISVFLVSPTLIVLLVALATLVSFSLVATTFAIYVVILDLIGATPSSLLYTAAIILLRIFPMSLDPYNYASPMISYSGGDWQYRMLARTVG